MQMEQRGAGLKERVRETWPDTERTKTMTTGLTRLPRGLFWGGFKLGAGWCNAPRPVLRGAGSNGWMVEIVWHRRETRRQQRRQTSTCTTRRTRSTHQSWPCKTRPIISVIPFSNLSVQFLFSNLGQLI